MKNEHDLFSTLHEIELSKESRARMREAVLSYADMHPTLVQEERPFYLYFLQSTRLPLYASLMALLVFTSAGVSFAAQGTVPGDSLYAIKVHVTEPFVGMLVAGDEGKARYASELAIRRLDEVHVLAASGRLSESAQTELEHAFEQNVQIAVEHTTSLADSGEHETAQSIREDFSASLASEAVTLSIVASSTPLRTAALVHKVLALSEENSVYTSQNSDDGEHTAPAALLGSTTPATADAPEKEATARAYRPRVLQLTASTSLSKALPESGSTFEIKHDSIFKSEDGAERDDSRELLYHAGDE